MVTIGFDQMTYSVFEGDDVTVCVSLLSGMLATDREVVVTVSTDDTIGSGGTISKCFKWFVHDALIAPSVKDVFFV